MPFGSYSDERGLGYLLAAVYSLVIAVFWLPAFAWRSLIRALREMGSESWPRSNASIAGVEVKVIHGWVVDYALARLDYSYRASGEYFAGSVSYLYPDEQAAWNFVDARKGRPAVVRYRDGRSEISLLRDADQDRRWNEPGPTLLAMVRQHWQDELKDDPPAPDLDLDTEEEETADHDSLKL